MKGRKYSKFEIGIAIVKVTLKIFFQILMQIEYIAYLTHLVCPALNYVLTLTISLHNYSKFKATGNLCLTKARIIQITPFSSVSSSLTLCSRLYGWIIKISMTYSWHVFLFIHTNSSVDVSKIRPRISGLTSIKSARSGPQDLPSLSNVVFLVGRGESKPDKQISK